MSIADIRQSYDKHTLLEKDAKCSPYEQFGHWFDQVLEDKVPEPTAMTLATADAQGRPSARIVLLKGYDENGFVFYTNYIAKPFKIDATLITMRLIDSSNQPFDFDKLF